MANSSRWATPSGQYQSQYSWGQRLICQLLVKQIQLDISKDYHISQRKASQHLRTPAKYSFSRKDPHNLPRTPLRSDLNRLSRHWPIEAAMSSPSMATRLIEDLHERTNEVSRTIRSYSDNVTHAPRQTLSIIESLSSLHKALGQLIESPFFQSPFTGESNSDQTSIFSMAVNRCGQELHEFLVQWAEVIKRNRDPRDEEYWSLINTMVQRVTETINVYTEAFQSCLTLDGR